MSDQYLFIGSDVNYNLILFRKHIFLENAQCPCIGYNLLYLTDTTHAWSRWLKWLMNLKQQEWWDRYLHSLRFAYSIPTF